MWHTCADSSGNGYMPNQLNLKTHGGIWGGGVTNPKVLGGCQTTGPIGTKFGTRLRIRLGMDNTIRPSTLGGGVRGSQIQKSGEDVKRLVRLASNLVHMCRFIREWIYAKQIALRDTRGHLGGLGGQTFKSQEAVKRLDRLAPTLVHVCGFIWEWA